MLVAPHCHDARPAVGLVGMVDEARTVPLGTPIDTNDGVFKTWKKSG